MLYLTWKQEGVNKILFIKKNKIAIIFFGEIQYIS